MGGGCRPNDSRHPCTPCGWSSAWWALLPSSSCHLMSPLSPCGTCGGGKSLIHCGVASSVMQAGCWTPGSLRQEPWSPSFVGVALVEPPWLPLPPPPLLSLLSEPVAGFLVRTRDTPSCGYAAQRTTRRPASSTFHIHSWHCSALL